MRTGAESEARARTVSSVLTAGLLWFGGGAGCGPAPELPSPPVVSEATGEHFQILYHSDWYKSRDKVLAVAEAVWPYATYLYDSPDGPLEDKLRIHLYDAADFARINEHLAEGRFTDARGFSVRSAREAHIALPPQGDTTRALAMLRRVAHEGAHLAALTSPGDPGPLPDWLAEGGASWIEREVARSHLRGGSSSAGPTGASEGPEDAIAASPASPTWDTGPETALTDPAFALHVRRVLALEEEGELPAAGGILLSDDAESVRTSDDYVVRSVLFEFLRTRRPETLEALLPFTSSALGHPGYSTSVQELANQSQLTRLYGEFTGYLKWLDENIRWSEAFRPGGP